jgi:membrane protein implicated in regulation of membrane protease activity
VSGTPRMMVLPFVAAGIVLAAVIALALPSWWVLGGVLAVHAIASGLVIAYTFKRASQSYDKPDPVTETRIEEEREREAA